VPGIHWTSSVRQSSRSHICRSALVVLSAWSSLRWGAGSGGVSRRRRGLWTWCRAPVARTVVSMNVRVRSVAVVCGLVLGVSGCASGGSEVRSTAAVIGSSSDTQPPSSTSTGDSSGVAHVVENQSRSPFTDFMYGPADKVQAAIVASRQATQDCMRSQGWETYVGFDTIVGAPPRDKDAFAREFFYGITTRLDAINPGEDQTPTPNADLESSLSPTEQTSYLDSLWSPADAVDPAKPGCMYIGLQAGFGDLRIVSPKLQETVHELDATVHADPDYQAAEDAWSQCMKTNGYSFRNTNGPVDELAGKVRDLAGTLGRTPTDADSRKAGLPVVEEKLFWDDMDCRASTDHGKRVSAVRDRIESAFLVAHPDLTEEI
jgi:hypothetical protein